MTEAATLNLEVLQECDALKRIGAEKMNFRGDAKRDPELVKNWPTSFYLNQGKLKYEVGIANLTDAGSRETIKVGPEGKVVSLVASVWITGESSDTSGSAQFWGLGEDGRWYQKTGTEYAYSPERNMNLWKMSKPTQVEQNVVDDQVFKALNKLEKPQSIRDRLNI